VHSSFKGGVLAAGLVLLAAAGAAHAQSSVVTRPSTPFMIYPVPADDSEKVAARGEPLLIQSASAIRAARLDAEAAAESAGWFKEKSFPAGTLMFGAYTGTRWSYCAVAETRQRFWSSDQFICYIDEDDDGRFDAAIDSGAPFQGVALLVFNSGLPRPLATPVPYSRLDMAEGPKVEYVIGFTIDRPRTSRRNPEVRPATHITPFPAFRAGDGSLVPLSGLGTGRLPLENGQTAHIKLMGAEIEILGVNDDNSVRYRVMQTMPRQIDQILMRLTTTTTWVYY